MFVRQVVHAAEDRQVLDSTGIQLRCLRTNSLRCRNSGRRSLVPPARSRTLLRPPFAIFSTEDEAEKVNFVARPAWQPCALRLRNISRGSFFRVEVRVGHGENKLGNWLRPKFRFQSLRLRSAEIEECLEKTVEADPRSRSMIAEAGQARTDATIPELLPDSNVPAQIAFRLQSEVVPENFILTARRTESCPWNAAV